MGCLGATAQSAGAANLTIESQISGVYGAATYSDGGSVAATKRQRKAAARSGKSAKSASRKARGKQYAAIPRTFDVAPETKSLSGGGVRWVASSGCLNGSLTSIVYQVAANFGPVTVSSTCRSKSRNRRVGGAPRSMHLSGNAVDFRVHANVRAAAAYLRSHSGVGGFKHYGGGLFHIDTGARRSW
ncbi:MAG: D-Ala-D-Ala carboxypeptidase family metallohydrolase [Hyphomicrobiaceae bacterium]|nr:D-Ala-D-Ala carboxypeptidase family metallohydrolase [Hyphomicrobiaceae bacterium]